MDPETDALRADIAQTRGELGEAAQELSDRLTPRRQAQRVVAQGRDTVVERLGQFSADDAGAIAARVSGSIRRQPQAAAAAVGVVALLVLRRRRRRR